MNRIPQVIVSAVALAIAGSAASAAQSPPVPPDAEVRAILAERVNRRQSVGIVVGLVGESGRRVITFGALNKDDPRPLTGDTLFEIGSVTKVFTSLLLSDMVQRGELALGDPVGKFLPRSVEMPAGGSRPITLEDLATHTSGLPRLPANLSSKDPANPYADYTVESLYRSLSAVRLTRVVGAEYEYSNLGGGLLGHVLARRAESDYETLVRARICEPLNMASTGIALSPAQAARQARGHDETMTPVSNWDLPTLAGAGALRSSANDLLRFLTANLGYTKSPLAPAMAAMLAVRRPTGVVGLEIALGWHVSRRDGREIAWHNGATGGYRSFLALDPERRAGVVVLSNAGTAAGIDDIGWHLLDPRWPLQSPPREHRATVLEPRTLQAYVGRYELVPSFVLTVTRTGDRLFVQATGQGAFEVFPEGPTEFFYRVVDAQIRFETDAEGRAVALVLHQNGLDQRAARIE